MLLRKIFKKSILNFFFPNNFCASAESWIYGQKTQLFNVEMANVSEKIFGYEINLFFDFQSIYKK